MHSLDTERIGGDCALSVVIPVFNEAENLPLLFERLYTALDSLEIDYEVIFVDDGSSDDSGCLLAAQHEARRRETRVIAFSSNYGQHLAIVAAFERSRGQTVLTLDADLQNPPEEIPRLMQKIEEGYDCVGTFRVDRQDSRFRRWASWSMNRIRACMTKIEMKDQGCMLRAYSCRIAKQIARNESADIFVPAVAFRLANRPAEIPVAHEERYAGVSNYSLFSLVRLNFDLITSCTLAPLQWFTLVSLGCSFLSFLLMCVLAGRRILVGPEEGGLFTLFGILFFLVSLLMVGVGLIGEYLGRAYLSNRTNENYRIQSILENERCETEQKYCSLDTVK